MRTAMLSGLLTIAMAAPAFADPWKNGNARGWGYGSDGGGQFWGWVNRASGDDGEDRDDDEDWDHGGRRQYRYFRAPSDSYDNRTYMQPRGTAYVRGSTGTMAGYELLEMDYRSLRGVLRGSAADFDRWLKGIPAGEVWRKHFEMRSLQAVLASDRNISPAPDERKTIMQILDVFDRSVETTDLRDLTKTDSFRTLHTALREYSILPEDRLLRQLSFGARMLNRSLGTFNTGVSWQGYLALPDTIIAAADRPLGEAAARSQPHPDELSRILDRYDRISRSQEYKAITSLPEFQATYQRLAALVKLLHELEAPPLVPAATEELPLPREQLNEREVGAPR